MRDCTVSVTSPKDGETHTVELTASSLHDAAAQAMQAWSQLWWWDPDLTLEVKCGDLRWNIGAGWVRASQDRRKGWKGRTGDAPQQNQLRARQDTVEESPMLSGQEKPPTWQMMPTV